MRKIVDYAAEQSRDGARIANYLLDKSSGYEFGFGHLHVFGDRRRHFGLKVQRGPWRFELTLFPDVHRDFMDYLADQGREPTDEEVARALKEKRFLEVPPLIAIQNRRGQEPHAPRGRELVTGVGMWFLRADLAGWPWRAPQSLKLLMRILNEIQGIER